MFARLPPWVRIALLSAALLFVPGAAWLLVPAPEPPRRVSSPASLEEVDFGPAPDDEPEEPDRPPPPDRRAPREDTEAPTQLRGVVVSGERIVPNATVTCTKRDGEEIIAAAVGNGQFTFPLEAEGCTAVATSPSYGVSPPVVLARDVDNRLELPAQGGVAGVVLDDRGLPLDKFFVEIVAVVLSDGSRTPNGMSRAFSDPEGRFSLDKLGAGRWTFAFSAAGRPPTRVEVVVEPGQVTEDVRVRLERGATLVGTVVDRGTKRPIGGATVRLDGPARDSAIEPVQTSPGGDFRLEGVPSGVFGIEVTKEGYLQRLVSGLDAGGQRQLRVTVDLAPAEEGARLEMSGIGASLNGDAGGRVRVVSLREGGPAERAGLLPDDVIAVVDGRSVGGLGVQEVVQLLRGPEGTEVSVSVLRDNGMVALTIVREVIVH